MVGTWLGEIRSCSCLALLPDSAWVLLNKIYQPFFTSLYNILYFWSGEEIERPETQHVVDVDFVASFASEIDKRTMCRASIPLSPPTGELMTSRPTGEGATPGVALLPAWRRRRSTAAHYVCPGISSRVGVSLRRLACAAAFVAVVD